MVILKSVSSILTAVLQKEQTVVESFVHLKADAQHHFCNAMHDEWRDREYLMEINVPQGYRIVIMKQIVGVEPSFTFGMQVSDWPNPPQREESYFMLPTTS